MRPSAPAPPHTWRASALSAHLHPDFSTNPKYGIPYSVVGSEQPNVPIKLTKYRTESDPGPYPVPPGAPIEGGGKNGHGDKHVLVLQEGTCKLYELYKAHLNGKEWKAAAGAVFDLRSEALRPEGWTSADAAGLPIFPLLARYPEVADGQIDHALRVTVAADAARLHPSGDALRLEQLDAEPAADGPAPAPEGELRPHPFHGQSLIVLQALKRYGLIVADNGSPWFITGALQARAGTTKTSNRSSRCPGSEFEAVESGAILHAASSSPPALSARRGGRRRRSARPRRCARWRPGRTRTGRGRPGPSRAGRSRARARA